jgi:outer membrane protein
MRLKRILPLVLLFSPAVRAEVLTLDDCVDRALRFNADVRLADYGLQRSAADVRAARAGLFPTISATALGYTRSRSGASIRTQENPTGEIDAATGQRIFAEEETRIPAIERDSYSFSTTLNQTIFDGNRRLNNWRSARRDEKGSEWSFKGRQATVAAAAKQAYYQFLKAIELVQVQEQAVVLSEKRLEEARARHEVGSGTRVDVLRLQVALENAQVQLLNAVEGVALARARLNHIMGEEIAAKTEIQPIDANAWREIGGAADLDTLLAGVERRNPSLLAVQAGLGAAEHDLKATRAARYPQLLGSVNYSRDNEIFDRVYQDLAQNYRLNLRLTVAYDIFDGGIKSANIDRSRTALESARIELEKAERELALAAETARLGHIRLSKVFRIAERTIELAQQDLRMAEERYRVGKGRLLEVLDAQVGFIEARNNLVRSRYDLMISRAELQRLQGTW